MGCPAGSRSLSSAPVATLLLVVALGCASQQTAAREQMQALQDRALLDVKKGQTASARKRLLVAVKVGSDAGLAYDPLMARTQMTLGALYAQAFKDEKRAVVYMSRALATTPEVKLPVSLSAPRARRALALARVRMANLSPVPIRERSQARRMAQPPPAPPVVKPAPRSRVAAAPPARPGRNRFRGRPRGRRGALPPLRQGPAGEPIVMFNPDGEPIPPPTGVLPPGPAARGPAARAPRVAIASSVPAPLEPPAEPALPDPEPGLRPRAAPAPLPPAVGRLPPANRRRLAQQQAAAPEAAPAPAFRATVTSRVPEPLDEAPAVVAAPPPAVAAPPPAPALVAAAAPSPVAAATPPTASAPRRSAGAAPSKAGSRPPAEAPPVVAEQAAQAAAAPAVASKVPPPEPPAAPTAVSSAPEPLPPPTFPEGHTDPLYCPVPLEAPPSHEVQLRCAVRPDLRPSRLMLHYRPAGSETFSAISMQRAGKGGFFQGVVPAEATSGKSLQFFVEAGGGAKINAGTAESPNVLLLREGATPVGERSAEEAASAEEEAAAEAERIRREDEDPLAASELKRELALVRRRPAGKFWAALGLGSGYGWQPGSDLEFRPNRRIDPGPLAAGLAHALPEIGYQLTDRLSISIQGRLQYAPVDGSGDPLPGSPRQTATAVLLRGSLGFGEGPLHFIATACAGWGKDGGFRLVVPADNKADLPRSDTIQGGPFLAGAGGGLVYHFNPRVSLPLELRALVGFPSVAAVLELGTGVVFAF